MNIFKIASFAVVAALTLPAVAQAREVKVSIKRYELATLAGQKAVVDRINRAARRTCFDPAWRAAQQARCARQLGEDMIQQVGDPTLVALWKGKAAVASR